MLWTTYRELGRNNVLLMVALFIWALGEGLWFNNLRQLYLAELGASGEQVGIALAIESILRAIPIIPAGYLSDRFGPYRVLLVSWVLGIVGPVVLALASTWQGAVIGLVVYALSAFAIPSISTYVLLSIPDQTLPDINQRALAAVFASYPAGLIISPFVGGWISEQMSIRTCLWISAVIFAVSLLVVLVARPVPPPDGHRGERPRDLARNGRFFALAFYFMVAHAAFFMSFSLAPNFLNGVRGFRYSYIGLLYSISSLGTVLINLVVASRVRRRWGYGLALAIVWLAVIGLWQARTLPVAALAFFGLGGMWTARTLSAAGVSSVVRPRNRGLAFGVVDTLYAVGVAVASRWAGVLFERTPSHDLQFLVTLSILPLLMAGWLVIRRVLEAGQRVNTPTSL